MTTRTHNVHEAELFDSVVHRHLSPRDAVAAGLDCVLASTAAARSGGAPDHDFVARLAVRLGSEHGPATEPASRLRSLAQRLRPMAAAFAVFAVLLAAVAAGWSAKEALSEDPAPHGVAYPVHFRSLLDAQGAVSYAVLSPPGGFEALDVRWYCMQFRDSPCSPQAAWIEAGFRAPDGREVTLKQGYFGTIAAGTIAEEFVPAGRKGTFTIRGLDGSWIDCRGEEGAAACSSADVVASDRYPRAPGENIAARNRLAAVGWLAAREFGSQRWIGLESNSFSPEELRELATELVPLQP